MARGDAVMPDMIGSCPVCGGELRVTRLRCVACDSELSGSFTATRLSRLKPEQWRFVEVFLKNEGTIKDVELELGISYPTVRARLRDVIRSLGFDVRGETRDDGAASSADRRREVLDSLARKEISVDDAARLLGNR
jgi:hypothetical protein